MMHSSNLARLWSVANIFFGVVSACHVTLHAQFGSSSTAGTIVTLSGMTSLSPHSLSTNASLSVIDTTNSLCAEQYPTRFSLSELQLSRLSVHIHPLADAALFARIDSFGSTLYRELTTHLSTSVKVSRQAAIGAAANMSLLHIQDYGSTSLLSFDVGLTMMLSPTSRFAATVHNVTRAVINNASQTVVQDMQVGFGTLLNDELSLDIDALVVLNRESGLRFALKYVPMDMLAERLAFDTSTTSIESHTELRVRQDLHCLFMFNVHEQLGLSIGGGVSYLW